MSLARFVAAALAMTSALGGCAAVLSLDSGEPRAGDVEAGLDVFVPDASDERGNVADDGACGPNAKSCNGTCAPESDSAVGCSAPGCDPCASRNAQATQVQTWQCAGGGCDIGACVINYKNCNLDAGDGCEVNGKTDPQHCGDCKNVCPMAALFCVDGACTSNCNLPNAICGTSCVPVKTDPDNCGTCGHKCPPPSGGNATCNDGGCDFTCTSPLVRCDPDGCIDTTSNVQHCGSCTYDCAAHAPVDHVPSGCVGGGCTFMCKPGYVDGGSGTCVLSGDGGCMQNAPSCTPGGSLCSGGPTACCGCACVGNICCLETGKPCSLAGGSQCCNGICNPAVGDGGSGGFCN